MLRSIDCQVLSTRGSPDFPFATASLKPVLISAGCRSTSRTLPFQFQLHRHGVGGERGLGRVVGRHERNGQARRQRADVDDQAALLFAHRFQREMHQLELSEHEDLETPRQFLPRKTFRRSE